ncbi:MAG: hypothetical protein CMI65_03035 [Pedosphaera sp.]|nr:hypothetical protein [Pedosphaera sp.]
MRDERNVFQLANLRSCLKNFGDNLGCLLKKIFKKGIVPKNFPHHPLFQVVLLEGAILWVYPGVH